MNARLFLDLALVLALTGAVGWLLRRIGQSAVIGEIAVGVLLGPTLVSPHLVAELMPAPVRSVLTGLANLGVALFMFTIGCEFQPIRRRAGAGRRVVTVAGCALLVPLALGLLLGLARAHAVSPHHRLGYVVFMGVAMSMTAFPVLARILRDRDLTGTEVATEALAVAAVSDVLGWLLLAAATMLATGVPAWRLALLVPYLVVLRELVPPVLRLLLPGCPGDGQRLGELTVVLVGLLASAAATEAIGLHFIFGAFAFGLAMPRGARTGEQSRDELRGWLTGALEPVSLGMLMPVYFVLAGMAVDLSGLGASGVGLLLLVLVLAAGGKLAGGYLGGRLGGATRRHAATVAVLLNTRGLTELVVLTVGRQVGLLDARTYSVLVVMALLTTAATGPLLAVLMPPRANETDHHPVRWREPAPNRWR
ncbi:MAG TPA: cation:proton antiporter [Jatrophihabitans sp.]|nr:cation:proton antiporter [Jatrophihabitans sp.]